MKKHLQNATETRDKIEAVEKQIEDNEQQLRIEKKTAKFTKN